MFFKDNIINQLIDLTTNAGNIATDKYRKNINFRLKQDKTPVTDVDILVNQVLNDGLKQITPNINIISEENEIIPFNIRKNWDEYWLIDPIDGTRGFIDTTDDFCICLAYIKNHQVVFGLIYSPVQQTTYFANSQNIAYKINNNIKNQILTKKSNEIIRVIVGRYSINKKRLKQHLDSVFGADNYTINGFGSALKFCYIAEGKYDYYPALGTCSEWDSAAGNFILTASGGKVIDFNGNSLEYNKRADLLSPQFFAYGYSNLINFNKTN